MSSPLTVPDSPNEYPAIAAAATPTFRKISLRGFKSITASATVPLRPMPGSLGSSGKFFTNRPYASPPIATPVSVF